MAHSLPTYTTKSGQTQRKPNMDSIQAKIEAIIRSAHEKHLDEVVLLCVNPKGEFVREGPAGMSETVYAHWKAKDDRRKERAERMRDHDSSETDNSSKCYDFMASLYGREDGEFKKEGAPEWLKDYCTAKEERDWQCQKKEEHEKKQRQKKLEYLRKHTQEQPRRNLKARLEEIAAMKRVQLAEEADGTKTSVKEVEIKEVKVVKEIKESEDLKDRVEARKGENLKEAKENEDLTEIKKVKENKNVNETATETTEVEDIEDQSMTTEQETGEDNMIGKMKKKGILQLPRGIGRERTNKKRTVRFPHRTD